MVVLVRANKNEVGNVLDNPVYANKVNKLVK